MPETDNHTFHGFLYCRLVVRHKFKRYICTLRYAYAVQFDKIEETFASHPHPKLFFFLPDTVLTSVRALRTLWCAQTT